ncbi:MAG: hypothetical protein ACOX3V_01810 [Bacillota bacterium]
MDTVWLCLIALGCATALLTGQVDAMMMSVIDGADQAIQLVIGLAGIYCLWSGIEKLAAESGLVDALASLTRPVLSFLFPRLKGDKHPLGTISATVISNMLGLSSTTPLGLKAMKEIQRVSKTEDDSMDSMIRLVVMCAAGFCVFPSSIIAIRAALGSSAPAAISGPCALAGLAATTGGLLAHRVLSRNPGKRR